jgi:hypothetical protein
LTLKNTQWRHKKSKIFQVQKGPINYCAAKAFYSCPAIISRRPRSQNILKEPQLNPEKDSRRKQARSHVTLEKSS